MPKTPDEIKKGLECCARGDCHSCPYVHNCILSTADALALIQQLQAENAEKDARIRTLESRNNALYHTILGVMHFVDKWLDVPAYDPDEDLNGTTAVGRASHAREIALQAIEQLEDHLREATEKVKQLEADNQQLEGMLTHMNQLRDAAAGRALQMEERVRQLETELKATKDEFDEYARQY